VRVEGTDNVTFRHVHARWDGGSVTANGAYALYPVGCGHVLIEDCEVEGAADAGIYVGQSHDVVVRRNSVHGNVAGIEFENCTNSCGYENTARDNVAGILVFNLPGLMVPGGGHTNVHNNTVDGNNRANFCHPGGIVCDVPVGIGIMVMAADHTEVHDNMITNNDSTGVLVVDFRSQGMAPMGYDPIETGVYIHDNTFTNNAHMPHGLLGSFTDPVTGFGSDILWDGYGTSGHSCADNSVNQVCIQNNGAATFRCGDAPTYSSQTMDIASHNCAGDTEACATTP
jgi:parallel beta-helix repeat protein